MKTRVLPIALAVTLAACVQFLANCSSPLESYPNPNPPEPLFNVDTVNVIDTLLLSDSVIVMDTVLQVDTLILVDSVLLSDTVIQVDTVLLSDTIIQVDTVLLSDTIIQVDTVVVKETVIETDTLYLVDTVIVYVSDSCGMEPICATLNCKNKKIVWKLDNPAGRYRLDFVGVPEKRWPKQELDVNVAGHEYEWTPQDNEELSIEADLGSDATVVITPDNPYAFGHSIRICLTLSRI